jgi:hypothetical protein
MLGLLISRRRKGTEGPSSIGRKKTAIKDIEIEPDENGICLCICIYKCIYIFVEIYIYVNMYIYVNIYLYINMHTLIHMTIKDVDIEPDENDRFLCICIYIYMCIYMYICTCLFIHKYAHIHTYDN